MELNGLFEKFTEELALQDARPSVLNLKSKYLGKEGIVSSALRSLKDASSEEKKSMGSTANALKADIQNAITENLRPFKGRKLIGNWRETESI